MLQVQYRMHPALAAFPSKQFYDGQLLSGVSAADRPPVPGLPWPNPAHGPFMFVDVHGHEVGTVCLLCHGVLLLMLTLWLMWLVLQMLFVVLLRA